MTDVKWAELEQESCDEDKYQLINRNKSAPTTPIPRNAVVCVISWPAME